MTSERERQLVAGIRKFIDTRGLHAGDHVYCCTNGGRCVRCDEAYIEAEAELDGLVSLEASARSAKAKGTYER